MEKDHSLLSLVIVSTVIICVVGATNYTYMTLIGVQLRCMVECTSINVMYLLSVCVCVCVCACMRVCLCLLF